MSKLLSSFRNYHNYHTKKATLWTHIIGVPLITLSLMIVLSWTKVLIPDVFQTNMAWICVFALMVYYFNLDVVLGFTTSIMLIFLCTIASLLGRYGFSTFSFWIFVLTFVLGWACQIIGHIFEGKKPALFDNFSLTLIAPMYIVAEIFFMLGYRHDLQQKLHSIDSEHKPSDK